MSSNLIKAYSTARETSDTRMIHTNDLIEQKLERIRMVMPEVVTGIAPAVQEEGFTDGIHAREIEMLTADYNSDEMQESALSMEAQEPVYSGPSPEEMIAKAQEEIATMRAAAEQEIEREKQLAYEEAQNRGYQEGLQKAREESALLRQELQQEKKRQEEEYERRIDELEPLFVKTLTGIYEKVFEVDLSEDKEIILTLLRNSMKKLDGCKNFLVHVAREDFSYVNTHKEELLSSSSQEGTVIDVIEDGTIRQNECTIETVNGIFDCGLGTQMEELKKRLILLSYEEHKES